MDRKCMIYIYEDTLQAIGHAGLLISYQLTAVPRGFFIFLFLVLKTSRDMEGNVPSRSPLPFGHFQKCFHALLSVARKV
jgi:hypothetical protein